MVDGRLITQEQADAAYAEAADLPAAWIGSASRHSRLISAIIFGYIAVDKLGIDERLLNEGGITHLYNT